jgi:hypothetical protein
MEGQEIFFFPTVTRLVLEPTHSHIQWVPEVLYTERENSHPVSCPMSTGGSFAIGEGESLKLEIDQ